MEALGNARDGETNPRGWSRISSTSNQGQGSEHVTTPHHALPSHPIHPGGFATRAPITTNPQHALYIVLPSALPKSSPPPLQPLDPSPSPSGPPRTEPNQNTARAHYPIRRREGKRDVLASHSRTSLARFSFLATRIELCIAVIAEREGERGGGGGMLLNICERTDVCWRKDG